MRDRAKPRPEIRLAPEIVRSIEILQLATLHLKASIEEEVTTSPAAALADIEPVAPPRPAKRWFEELTAPCLVVAALVAALYLGGVSVVAEFHDPEPPALHELPLVFFALVVVGTACTRRARGVR